MRSMTTMVLAALMLAVAARAEDLKVHTFQKFVLTDQFFAEGAAMGDFNKDGQNDVAYGPFWYAGPDFKKRTEFMADKAYDKHGYSNNFFTFVFDINNDGFADIMIYGFPGKDASWYENPKGKEGHWVRHNVLEIVDNESPTFTDVNGDGKPDIVCSTGGFMGYATADWTAPEKPWTFHKISPQGPWQKFTHGLGVGDVNGDGKLDILEQGGWWEQPKDLAGDPVWTKHPFAFGNGGSQMHVYDVDGDGLNDVICSLQAHGYGLAWFKQVKEGETTTFKQNLIMGSKPEENAYGLKFSQMHAVDLIDMDGDGVKDIVTGKRHWAHGPKGDPEPEGEPVLYWFKTVRAGGNVTFIPYLIDNDSGVGTQVLACDVNNDKLPDIVIGNKKGSFVFIQQCKTATKEEWEKAQPQKK